MVHGRNIMIYRGGTLIAGTRVNKIATESETIEITDTSNSRWRKHVAGRLGWNISVDWLVPAVSNIREVLNVGTVYTLQFRDRAGDEIITGQAILTSVTIDADTNSLAKGAFSFKGNGELA